MKKIFPLLLLSLSLLTVKADYWTQKATFPGSNRFGCFSFNIGTKGYIGCGYDSGWATTQKFWEYDKQSNSWTQKADFAGTPRVYATGFAILTKGYAGLGVDPAGGWMQDFWEYNPATNAWSSIANFGGGQRSEACSFVVNNKAYVGTGSGVTAPYTFDDLWEYNPLSNTWSQKTSLPGAARLKALGFSAGNYGYIVTGFSVTNYFTDLWQYDPVTDSWLPRATFTGDPRSGASGCTLNDKIYLGTGNNQPATGPAYVSKDWWKYDPVSNQWTQKNSFSGLARNEAAYFTLDKKGYVGIGVKANIQYNDFWEYTGDSVIGTIINDPIKNNIQYTIYPNPAKSFITICIPPKLEYITITNIQGKKVYSQQFVSPNADSGIRVNISNYLQGIYFVTLYNGSEKTMKRFLKE